MASAPARAKGWRSALPCWAALALGLTVAGCAGGPTSSVPPGPTVQKVGRPYKIKGQWYYPRVEEAYDQVGIASWYGPQFHGRLTANGEIFDMNQLTAAHTTLPLPSYAEITNLDNGRRVVVRINDRGPFIDGRLIDLSRKAAEELDFAGHGLARVRVRVVEPPPDVVIVKASPAARTSPVISAYAPSAPIVDQAVATGPIPVPDPRRRVVVASAAPLPVPSPQTSGGASYLVQVGTFSQEANALRLQRDLSVVGPVEVLTLKDQQGAVLHGVRVGPFLDRADAESALQEIRAYGLNDARILVN